MLFARGLAGARRLWWREGRRGLRLRWRWWWRGRRLRRLQHRHQPVGRLRGQRGRGRLRRREGARLQGHQEGPQGGGRLAGLRHRRGRRGAGELGPRRPEEEVHRRPEDRRAASVPPATPARSAGTCRRGWPRSTRTSPTTRTSTSTRTMFKTSESGDKGQLLDGDPSFVTNDAALVKNLEPELQGRLRGQRDRADPVVPAGGEGQEADARLLLRAAVVLLEVPLVKVKLPRVQGGLRRGRRRRSPATTRPTTWTRSRARSSWTSDSPAAELVKNFKWTNDDQNLVAKYIAVDKMTPEDAAEKWVEGQPSTRWTPGWPSPDLNPRESNARDLTGHGALGLRRVRNRHIASRDGMIETSYGLYPTSLSANDQRGRPS